MKKPVLYVLEWSRLSTNIHIQTLASMTAKNIEAFQRNGKVGTSDWLVLHVGTDDECHALADKIRPTLQVWENARRAAEERDPV